MAEREGFEPSEELSPLTRLAGERLQPARPSLLKTFDTQRFLIIKKGIYCFCRSASCVDYIKLLRNFIGGGSRIRTHGGVTLNGFQDRRFRPLSHPSMIIRTYIFIIPVGDGQYLYPFRLYYVLTGLIFYGFESGKKG